MSSRLWACVRERGWLGLNPTRKLKNARNAMSSHRGIVQYIFNMDLARCCCGKDYLLSAEFLSKFRALKVRDLF
ncbi:unnamed protein product [Sphagnum balticum]